MKKINNIRDIQVEKMQLRIRQLEQEKNLSIHWAELKSDLDPRTLFEKIKLPGKNKESLKSTLISKGLDIGAGIVSQKLTEITGRKIETAIQRGFGKLAAKINAGLRKKS
jgi:hypothetical protein